MLLQKEECGREQQLQALDVKNDKEVLQNRASRHNKPLYTAGTPHAVLSLTPEQFA
jgi:hypothetical protein